MEMILESKWTEQLLRPDQPKHHGFLAWSGKNMLTGFRLDKGEMDYRRLEEKCGMSAWHLHLQPVDVSI
jgi:hypothetical protein